MRLTITHYYGLIEESYVSRDILDRLSRVCKNATLKNFFFEQAQKRELYATELKKALSYNFNFENFSSAFAKKVFKSKFRKSILSTSINRSNRALISAFNELYISDINTYAKIIRYTKEDLYFYDTLINQHNHLRDSLKHSASFAVKDVA